MCNNVFTYKFGLRKLHYLIFEGDKRYTVVNLKGDKRYRSKDRSVNSNRGVLATQGFTRYFGPRSPIKRENYFS